MAGARGAAGRRAPLPQAHVGTAVEDYVLALVRATRESASVHLGASPRATLALYRGAQALAALRGRAFVLPDDVKALAVPVLAHRLVLARDALLDGGTAGAVLREVVRGVPVPVESAAPDGAGG